MCTCASELSDERFSRLLGAGRGSARRPADPDVDPAAYPLTHRIYDHDGAREYHAADALVSACERCGHTGAFLVRDRDDVRAPALCEDCHEQLDTSHHRYGGGCCEDWCAIDVDHDGLCRPR